MTERFDWQKAHERFARIDSRLQEKESPEAVRWVLHNRAVALAAPLTTEADVKPVDYIVFRIGEERFAVEAIQVEAALSVENWVALPGVPPFHLGLISHRGAVYAFIDIRPILQGRAGSPFRPGGAIVVTAAGNAAAIAVEAIEGLVQVDQASLVYAHGESATHSAILGSIQRSTTVIDLHRLLMDARLIVDEQPLVRSRSEGGVS